MFKQVGKVLINSRRRMDASFFQQIGYAMVNWSVFKVKCGSHYVHIDQSSLEFIFLDTHTAFLSFLDKIPLCDALNSSTKKMNVDKI